jgi:hypothetical protein
MGIVPIAPQLGNQFLLTLDVMTSLRKRAFRPREMLLRHAPIHGPS